jgi:hypothetical protein
VDISKFVTETMQVIAMELELEEEPETRTGTIVCYTYCMSYEQCGEDDNAFKRLRSGAFGG